MPACAAKEVAKPTHALSENNDHTYIERRKGLNMATKETSDEMSRLASRVLSGEKKPTLTDAKRLAGAVLGQDEHKGRRPTPKPGPKKR